MGGGAASRRGAEMMRSPDALMALVRGIDVVNNFAFLPHRRAFANAKGGWDATPVLTACNLYVNVCTAALGRPIPPKKANEQVAWLKSERGMLAGWMPVDGETARQRAESGYPTVAATTNPAGHGHIALVVPADASGAPGIYVSSAGATNHVRCVLHRSFGVAAMPEYWTNS